ncbi:MAG: division/cell wall cluster transcriptional repressor MraZ [Marivibrio sp.]|uniref:division/cell wall cluster transcriptional repressor MraZ n=1 Tax=Marivibrio sp. TaxID=2039719 RepID=UPI0032ED98CF
MALFTGTFENKVDKKGRVSLPADFRAELPDEGQRVVYIYPSPRDEALEACDKQFMQRIVDSIEDAPLYSDEEDDLGASIVANARKAQLDETGRLVLPPDFARLAGIDGAATFVGRGSRFQIWSPQRFAEHSDRARQRVKGRTLPLRPKGGGNGEG